MKTITTPEERKDLVADRVHHLIDETTISHTKFFSHVYLNPGDEVKVHEHIGEYELYYILTGNGIYIDNGKESPVEKGYVTHCEAGNSHGLKNTGDTVLEFIALIVTE